MDLVLATRNLHKLRELEGLLAPHRLHPLPDGIELPPEDGASFEENALIKARAATEATGSPAVADDSGIAVAALGGAPGIHSARYAGEQATDEQNLAKLIAAIDGHPDRRAAYVCVLALCRPGSRTSRSRDAARECWSPSREVKAASATTRSSSPTSMRATGARWPS